MSQNFKIDVCKSDRVENPHLGANSSQPCLTPEHPPFQDSENSWNSTDVQNVSLNSYKFPKPRMYIPNDFPKSGFTVLDRLKLLAKTVGPKERPEQYNEHLTRLLQFSKPKRVSNKKKQQEVLLNAVSSGATIKLVKLNFLSFSVSALVDTGSTHCLLSIEAYQKFKDKPFMPIKLHMKVAGHVLKDNIIGKVLLPVQFETKGKSSVVIAVEFLIAHALNGYDAILGADLLMNSKVLSAITPSDLVLTTKFGSEHIPMFEEKAPIQANLVEIKDTVTLPPHSSMSVKLELVSMPQNASLTETGIFETNSFENNCNLKSNNKMQYSLSNVFFANKENRELNCILTNKMSEDLHFDSSNIVATLSHDFQSQNNAENPSTILNSIRLNSSEFDSGESENVADSLEEEILQENMLVDTTDIEKTFSWKDCEIKDDLDPVIKSKLLEVLEENQSVFAQHKLDVGKFPHFTVQLEIENDIPAEKQRFMSEEKQAFCDKTFDFFEKMKLVEECHTPKTISNLHLVPKYEGLRDLTKASTYLAQVKGIKNSQFRIVQDLRRVNAQTKNIKKTVPKLPEQIFQKLRGKIVSSMDANQAYWHLLLCPESRPFTCFWLRNKVMQFNRMVQGLASAPACWDQAMSLIFSAQTMAEIKKQLSMEEASQLPDDFDSFFAYWQDDSWIFSDFPEQHVLHIKAVLMAYKLNDIKISPNKSTFFPESFKILGVSFSPQESTLALDRVKAQSILDWEKPDSLYTLQSRLYALNYWTKFIPNLAEIKFPLNQILRSGIFSWTKEADDAWESIKALIALDIRLTIPNKDEQLLLTTDASKIACSCILWVFRNGHLKVVGCYSKLFSLADSLKNIHFKETFALVQAFKHFRPYLLNTTKTIVVFTDARSLIWVSRNREYSIACNGLVNKLARIQLEIPHKVFSVPSEVNYLADLFSRAFNTSRFLDKSLFSLSKIQASKVPPLSDPFVLDEAALYQYFAQPLKPEKSDEFSRNKSRISTPKPIKSLYKIFQDCTPEEKYLSALRLLQGWDDRSIPDSDLESNALEVIAIKDQPLYNQFRKRLVEKKVKETMKKVYDNLDPELTKRIEATLYENFMKLAKEDLSDLLKKDFLEQETLLNNVTVPKDCSQAPIHYILAPESTYRPGSDSESNHILLPLQRTITLQPHEMALIDMGVQIFIPDQLFGVIKPFDTSNNIFLFSHTGLTNSDCASSLKIFAKNSSDKPVTVPAGRFFVKISLCSNKPCRWEHVDTEQRSNMPIGIIHMQEKEPSLLHMFIQKHLPTELRPIELGCQIALPDDPEIKLDVIDSVRHLDKIQGHNIFRDCLPPLSTVSCNQETVVQDLTSELLKRSEEEKSKADLPKDKANSIDKERLDKIKNDLYVDMCQKLAVLGIDLLKNKTLTRDIFARAQQSDDYFSVIYHAILEGTGDFPQFILKNSVLYKKIHDKVLKTDKYVICLPDILMPSVLHTLHVTLGHPSVTATRKNFQAYYYNRQCAKLTKEYVHACITCSFAGKYDLRKVKTSTERSLQPSRPRQHMYCDLIPMPKSQFSYILFCLDAYSQFVYALPLKDKTAASVYQGFLSLFSTVGWYEALYFDNEASFQNVAKLLLKISPMSIHYSVPYCHFQNNAENYIKSFKRNFLKILNDNENPQDNQDWALILPTVTQSLNRQVIQSLGVSRECLHYNMSAQFYPLAEISADDFSDTDTDFEQCDIYDTVKTARTSKVLKSRRAKVPVFFINQIVFVIDQTPSIQGVSSVLKPPTRGPFRIQKIDQRNVTLTDIETGKTFNSHVELLRPLSVKEFRLLLSKDWDLNAHFQKAAYNIQTRSTFDSPFASEKLETVLQTEQDSLEKDDSLGLDNLFDQPISAHENEPLTQLGLLENQNSPKMTTRSQTKRLQTEQNVQDNADILQSVDLECISFNSFKAEEDLSKSYQQKLKGKRPLKFLQTLTKAFSKQKSIRKVTFATNSDESLNKTA